ncbi:caspase recruitment domain-containing protein 8-like isoform X2 [Macrotis lagotis]|uniref:caspase recruitment domain-containing protein 8-like isoform X2 n=1 Tax=Macrotis lagotis TaxID=92651 RepID=UPI003D687B76
MAQSCQKEPGWLPTIYLDQFLLQFFQSSQAIDEEEAKFHFLRLHKPPPVTPLYIDSLFLVSGSKHLKIMPTELKLLSEC